MGGALERVQSFLLIEGLKINFMLVTQKEQFGISVVRFVKTWTFVRRLVIHKAAP